MRKGRDCPISGGSTIGGKSGESVCVRPPSRKAGDATSACSRPRRQSFDDGAVFLSAFLLVALFWRFFAARVIGCPRSARAPAPWRFRGAVPANPARPRPDKHPPSSPVRRQPAHWPTRLARVSAAIPIGPTRHPPGREKGL